MRQPTLATKRWHTIHATKLERRRYRKASVARRNEHLAGALELYDQFPDLIRVVRYRHRTTARVIFPSELCLEDNQGAVARVVAVIRRSGETKAPIYFDFSSLQLIDDATALVIAAEIDRAFRIHFGGKPKSIWKDRRWHPVVEFLLGEMGFFELLRVKNPPAPLKVDIPIRFIKFLTGQGSLGAEIEALKERYNEFAAQDIDPETADERRPLYGALIEAMANVGHHAYEEGTFIDDIRNRWWMAGSYDKDNHRFTTVFYDVGIGIPRSLEITTTAQRFEAIKRHFRGQFGDAERIVAAMTRRGTRTGSSHRGRGLKEMRGLAKSRAPSTMHVFSGRGEYRVEFGAPPEGNKEVRRSTKNHSEPIPGTLIWWQASL